MKYHQDFENGERIFSKIKHGGTVELISYDGQLNVIAKVEYYAGVYGLALKKAGDKKFGKSYVKSSNDIIGYFAQFKEV